VDKTARLALGRIAASQRGLFSAAQASTIGVSNRQLVRAQSSGALRRVRRGVYAMAGIDPSPWEQIVAAALAAGPDAVVSHASAAAVHRFEYGPFPVVELTLPRQGRFRPPGVTVHRSTDLADEDIVERNGVLVTSAPRTLVDLAGRLGPALTEKLLDEGLIVRRWSVEQLQDCLGRARQNVPERAKLRELLALRAEEPSADSMLESRVFRALGPLMPFEVHFSTVLGGRVYVIDAAWPEAKVGAEIVGRAHRVASRSAFDRERRKLNELGAFGWTVAHLTAAMSAEEMIAAVGALLGRSRARRVPLRSKNDRNSRQARGEGSQRDQTPPQDQPSGASFIP
jgi:very-short-patch-repair endonuclease